MLITLETAKYMASAIQTLEMYKMIESPIDIYKTDECPGCGRKISVADEDHLMARIDGKPVMLVGCEGYWVISPELAGCSQLAPNWNDWTEIGGEYPDED